MNTKAFRYTGRGTYTAEASDLGLPPGLWPASLDITVTEPYPGKAYSTGGPTIHRDGEGDITHVTYDAPGARFVIWND